MTHIIWNRKLNVTPTFVINLSPYLMLPKSTNYCLVDVAICPTIHINISEANLNSQLPHSGAHIFFSIPRYLHIKIYGVLSISSVSTKLTLSFSCN